MKSYRGKTIFEQNGMFEFYSDKKEKFVKYDDIKSLYEAIDEDMDDVFNIHGYYTVSNLGGYEVEISDCGDSARMRDAYGCNEVEVSEWKEIEYIPSEDEEEELVPIIDPEGYDIPLNLVMRANF